MNNQAMSGITSQRYEIENLRLNTFIIFSTNPYN